MGLRIWGSMLASYGSFRKLGLPYLGIFVIRTLLFRVLYQGPLFSETPILGVYRDASGCKAVSVKISYGVFADASSNQGLERFHLGCVTVGIYWEGAVLQHAGFRADG